MVNRKSGFLETISVNSVVAHFTQVPLPKLQSFHTIDSNDIDWNFGNVYTGMFAMSGFVMLLALDRTIIIFGNKKCKELRKNNIAMGLSITVWVSLGRLLKSDRFLSVSLLLTGCQLLRTFYFDSYCMMQPRTVKTRQEYFEYRHFLYYII